MSEEKKLIEVKLPTGTFYTERMIEKYSNRGGWQPANPNHITAFIPGTIVELMVNVGDTVKEGETLMLFGAMKMDNIIVSPINGRVKAINATLGESVPKGFVMIEVE